VEELLRNLPNHPDVTMMVQTGTEYWYTGLITLALHGNGLVEIDNRQSGSQRLFQGYITPEELQRIGTAWADAGLTTLQPSDRLRQPDDLPVVVAISQAGTRLFQAQLWEADRYENPGLDHFLKQSDALIARVTDGRLPWPGA